MVDFPDAEFPRRITRAGADVIEEGDELRRRGQQDQQRCDVADAAGHELGDVGQPADAPGGDAVGRARDQEQQGDRP